MQINTLHPSAIVETDDLGSGCKIGPFAYIHAGVKLGDGCEIGSSTVLESGVVLGNRVVISSGVHLHGAITIADDVVIEHGVNFGLGRAPHASANPHRACSVQRNAFIGANATIAAGVVIGAHATVEPGAVVTRDVPPNAVVTGNPAKISGYGDGPGLPVTQGSGQAPKLPLRELRVRGAKLLPLPLIVDLRGSIIFGEIEQHLPFKPERFFVVFDVPGEEVRGEHAHHELQEFLVCLKGSISIALDDGVSHDEVRLDDPTVGLYVPPKLWRVHYKYSADAVMLSLCSDIYKTDDYIRDYDEFQSIVGASETGA